MSAVVLPAPARKALATYAAADDETRGRLARVRRYDYKRDVVRHFDTTPGPLRRVINELSPVWRALWSDFHKANEVLYLAAARASLRDQKATWAGQYGQAWSSRVLQAADLEAQATAAALTLRAKGAPITDAQFAVLTAAWRKAGLPLPTVPA